MGITLRTWSLTNYRPFFSCCFRSCFNGRRSAVAACPAAAGVVDAASVGGGAACASTAYDDARCGAVLTMLLKLSMFETCCMLFIASLPNLWLVGWRSWPLGWPCHCITMHNLQEPTRFDHICDALLTDLMKLCPGCLGGNAVHQPSYETIIRGGLFPEAVLTQNR